MEETTSLTLQPSESTVVEAASRIFAAYIIANKASGENEDQMLEKALRQAIHLAKRADILIESDDELKSQLSQDGF